MLGCSEQEALRRLPTPRDFAKAAAYYIVKNRDFERDRENRASIGTPTEGGPKGPEPKRFGR